MSYYAGLAGGLLALLSSAPAFAVTPEQQAPAIEAAATHLAAAKRPEQTSPVTAPREDAEVLSTESPERKDATIAEPERDMFTLGQASTHNADESGLTTTTLHYRNHRRPWIWPWQDASSRSFDWAVEFEQNRGDIAQAEFNALRAMARLGHYGPLGSYGELAIGAHRIESGATERRITPYEGMLLFGLNKPLQLELRAAHDFLGTGASRNSAVMLEVDDLTAALRWRAGKRLRLLGLVDHRSLSDGNSSLLADASLMVGLSPEWPWIWAGLGGEYLDYQRLAIGYWTPRRYIAFGPRFESSFPLAEGLHASASANANWISDNGTEATGAYMALGLEYRIGDGHRLRLDYTRGESLQNRSRWWEDRLMLRFSGGLL